MKRSCPYCSSSHVVKVGHNASGTQRYKCGRCRRTHTTTRRKKSLVDLRRLAAAILVSAGYSYRDAAKLLGISQQTVKNCVGEYASEIDLTLDEAIYDNPSFTYLADNAEHYDGDA